MKIELTIKTDYLPNWGVWEGCRELIQNGIDAETEFDAPIAVTYSGDKLRIRNEGVTLPYEALLLGHTSKSHRADLIGQFGEGLKLGLLALVRAGHDVKIRSGSEVWIPRLERSANFNADVLTVEILKGRKPRNRIQVEIGGLSKASFELIRKRFLRLNPPKRVLKASSGQILLDPENRGDVFVMGILVERDEKLHYGYNLMSISTDRDRKMVAEHLKYNEMARYWASALDAAEEDIFSKFYFMLKSNAPDIQQIEWFTYFLPIEVLRKTAEKFKESFGENAYPAEDMEQSRKLEFLGKRGIVTSKPMLALLSKELGDFETVVSKAQQEVKNTYSWGDLTSSEKSILLEAQKLVADSGGIRIVDFNSETLYGQYKDGQVYIARWVLQSFKDTLITLIHEFAHKAGGDGDCNHVAEMEKLWGEAVMKLRGQW